MGDGLSFRKQEQVPRTKSFPHKRGQILRVVVSHVESRSVLVSRNSARRDAATRCACSLVERNTFPAYFCLWIDRWKLICNPGEDSLGTPRLRNACYAPSERTENIFCQFFQHCPCVDTFVLSFYHSIRPKREPKETNERLREMFFNEFKIADKNLSENISSMNVKGKN